MALEAAGVPTVAVHTHVFARLVRAVAAANGMPTLRQAFVPQPVVGRTAAELRAYIEGTDPINSCSFIESMIGGLTRPLDGQDLTGLSYSRSTPRLLDADTEDNLRRQFDENRWTDFAPIVLPTEERVAAMLAGTSRAPDEVVGRLRPTFYREFWEFTVEKVAINAVMAGCKPEYMPVVLGAVEAALIPNFAMHGLLCTLYFSGPVVIVNGPIAKRIGMNCGLNALGQGNRANGSIGRALQLIIRNVGGGIPGGIDRACLGNPGKYTFCFAEDESDPEWEPLSVWRGARRGKSAVTLFHGDGVTAFSDHGARTAEELVRSLATSLVTVGHIKLAQWSNAIVVLTPEHYRLFREAGWDRRRITDALHDATTRPGRDLVKGAQGLNEGIDPKFADRMMPKFWKDHGLLLVRAGGDAGMQSAIIGGWSAGRFHDDVQPVTKEISE